MEFQRLLAKASALRPTRWFTKELPLLSKDVRTLFLSQSAVLSGGVASGGTIAVDAVGLSVTASQLKLNGQLKATLAALSNVDILTAASLVAAPIFLNGSPAAGVEVESLTGRAVTLIAANSDGAGGSTGDNGVAKYIAIVGELDSVAAVSSYSRPEADIRAALAASTGVHDGTTGYVRLADLGWVDVGGAAVFLNVNRTA